MKIFFVITQSNSNLSNDTPLPIHTSIGSLDDEIVNNQIPALVMQLFIRPHMIIMLLLFVVLHELEISPPIFTGL